MLGQTAAETAQSINERWYRNAAPIDLRLSEPVAQKPRLPRVCGSRACACNAAGSAFHRPISTSIEEQGLPKLCSAESSRCQPVLPQAADLQTARDLGCEMRLCYRSVCPHRMVRLHRLLHLKPGLDHGARQALFRCAFAPSAERLPRGCSQRELLHDNAHQQHCPIADSWIRMPGSQASLGLVSCALSFNGSRHDPKTQDASQRST